MLPSQNPDCQATWPFLGGSGGKSCTVADEVGQWKDEVASVRSRTASSAGANQNEIQIPADSFGRTQLRRPCHNDGGRDGRKPQSLQPFVAPRCLLAQWASQWGGLKDGYFRAVFSEQRVSGPIIATYTANDQAVGIAYPIACRLAGQNSTALGDANDPFGGVGRNGVLHVLPSERGPSGPLLPRTGTYRFEARKTNNLLSDKFVKNHGDVKKRWSRMRSRKLL
jgi:hypothetical protein